MMGTNWEQGRKLKKSLGPPPLKKRKNGPFSLAA
jgi:hypothetical protein